MSLRSILLSTVAASVSLLALGAHAHDPSLHEPHAPPAKAKPTTCVQLGDTERYSSNLSDPDIKALKAKCDAAAKKTAAKKPAAKTK